MSKKILFVIPSMEIGGTRSSLLNLLNVLSLKCDAELYLFIVKHEGDLLPQIPPTVHVLPEIKLLAWATPSRRKHNIFRKLFHGFIAILNRLFGYQRVYRSLLKLSRRNSLYSYIFDLAIGYQEGIATFVSSEVNSKYHYVWIHSDIDKWFEVKNFESESYSKARKVLFVAENTKNLFASRYPEWKDKCEVIKNLLNIDLIIQKAQEQINDVTFELNNFNIVSIGRFTEAKAFDRVIEVAKYLRSKGLSFKWYLIGNGELYTEIERLIQKEELKDSVILLGAKNNPYPYIKKANLIVVSSIYESQPMVILEALTLSVPVVSTGYPSAMEILQNGQYGLVCGNDTQSLCSAVEKVINDNDLYGKMVLGAKEYEYNNDEILNKMRRVINF